MGSVFNSLAGIGAVDGVPFTAGSAAGLGLRIVRLEPVPVPGVCRPEAELGVPSAGRTCSGFGLVVEFILPGVEGVVSGADCAPARLATMRSVAARAAL